MSQLSKKLDYLVKNSKVVLPVKTDRGILVGDILIISEGSLKHLEKNKNILYENIHLNIAAITIANLLALRRSSLKCSQIYDADQDYGRWFVDSQYLRTRHQKLIQNDEFERADVLWARYIESRDKTLKSKNHVEFLCRN